MKRVIEPTHHCPKCESMKVGTEHHELWLINTQKFYCHSMKPHDDDSPATCLDCDWQGLKYDLLVREN